MNTKSLNSDWQLSNTERQIFNVPISFPNDVHSALIAADKIEDPYWRDNELQLDWVHETEWVTKRSFDHKIDSGTYTLRIASLDTCTTITLNGQLVAKTESQHIRYEFDVTELLVDGDNELEIKFHSNTLISAERNAEAPFSIPYQTGNCRIPYTNFIRKTQCHAGWDWNIAIMPMGIYGGIELIRSDAIRLDEVKTIQHYEGDKLRLEIFVYGEAKRVANATATAAICGQQVEITKEVYPGENTFKLEVTIGNPQLWWPVGEGEQILNKLEVTLDGHTSSRNIGFRRVELDVSEDEVGNKFLFRINDREIFMKGANWIPADALPARGTPEVVRDLLQSALDANMNMLRIWGGGQYEEDWFYDLCDEMGIMIWQDFMFACNIYPGYDNDWLELVRVEARQQVRRLSSHASVVLFCGDNELVGALGWWEETRNDRDRYIANYDRLNHALEEVVEQENTQLPWWPSSPSVGKLNFGDGWHIDTSGDMHFWDVWHSSKDFEHYRTVKPRFCSEFGFQSFPSMRIIESFTEDGDRDATSPVMDIHQRNIGGNERIVETMTRYFKQTENFEDLVFTSQISQALAMKTSCEFWRASKPRCMGTLYWQLNDTWPVASWASLEYGGGWKLTQYLARNFNAPVLVTAVPENDDKDIVLTGVNDTQGEVELTLIIEAVTLPDGNIRQISSQKVKIGTERSDEIGRIAVSELAENEMLHYTWSSENSEHVGENQYYTKRYKEYTLGNPEIKTATGTDDLGEYLEVSTDKVALFVTLNHGDADIYSDNGFTLLPNRPKRIYISRARSGGTGFNAINISQLKG